MSTVAEVERILARARRLWDGIRTQRGAGASWEFEFPDGITERYTIRGQQPVENLEDDVASLFIWAWSTKDYLKELVRARGQDPQHIENLVDRTPALCLLGDLANRLSIPSCADGAARALSRSSGALGIRSTVAG